MQAVNYHRNLVQCCTGKRVNYLLGDLLFVAANGVMIGEGCKKDTTKEKRAMNIVTKSNLTKIYYACKQIIIVLKEKCISQSCICSD
jgi:hypothetical protein